MTFFWPALDSPPEHRPGAGATAFRNVPLTLDLFDTHFPRFPVLPGVLVLDAAAALALAFLERETGPGWRLAEASGVRWRHYVQPGDRLDLAVECRALESDEADLSATGRVGDRMVASFRSLRFRR